MQTAIALPTSFPTTTNKPLLWTGRVISALGVAFLAFDAAMKLAAIAPVVEATTRLGFAASTVRPIGAVLLVATLLFAIPRTAIVGALLLTAYLGGATATMVHAGQSVGFPIAMGVILWAGLVMRRPQLRALLAPSV